MSEEDQEVDGGERSKSTLFLPAKLLEDSDSDYWVEVEIDESDGDVEIKEVDESRLNKAEEKYVRYLHKRNLVDDETAEEVLS